MPLPKILAIDDDEMVLSYLARALGESYIVVSSSDPLIGVELAQSEKPDLILCDIDMPNMDGGDVCKALAKNPATAQIPFMYLTSMVSSKEARELDGNIGGRPGVAKQAKLPELLAAIEAALRDQSRRLT
jgi:CheY-like chemotaxis protein